MISFFKQLEFANPYWIILLGFIPILIAYYVYKHRKQHASLNLPGLEWTENLTPSIITRLRHIPFILRILVIALLSIAMARPQTSSNQKEVNVEGIDIVMALDVSSSMRAQDLRPNRLKAAKKVAKTFISSRKNDRIGLVVFSGEAFTQCPLTTDHTVLKNLFKPIEIGMIEDGTAIGDGLATAINRIKDSKAISRVIILLTDGVQNRGSIDPISAAEISKDFGIRIYTIGVGSKGTAPMPVQTPFGEQIIDTEVDIDEDMLTRVAQITDGKYFRATNNKSLESIYSEIDKLEKSKIDVNVFLNKTEEFLAFGIAALILLIIELTLRLSIFRIKP